MQMIKKNCNQNNEDQIRYKKQIKLNRKGMELKKK